MKEHAKKALKHDTKVLGKTVPTMIIIGLFLVGGGSAAILSSFGTVSGEATVEQAVTFEGQSDNSAITADYNTGSQESIVAGQVFAQSETLTNDAENPATVTIESITETVSGTDGNADGVDNTVLDVTDRKTVTTDAGVELEIGYDKADDEVTFTPTQVSTYNTEGSIAGVVFGFDTDNDGTYDFQVDSVSSGYQPDLYEYTDQSTGKSDYVEHYNFNDPENSGDGTVEHNRVFFTNSDTQLQDKDSFTLTVDAERLGSSFSVNAEQDGSSFLSGLDASDATKTHPGEDVTDSEVTLQGESSRDLAIITGFAINLDPSYDYTVTTDVVPAGQDVDGESVETPTDG